MKAKIESKIGKRWEDVVRWLIALVLAVAVIVILVMAGVELIHVPQYTNMSDDFARDQLYRSIADADRACKEAGGQGFVVGGGGCVPLYEKFEYPKQPWYITPEPNPMYLRSQFGALVFFILAAVVAVFCSVLLIQYWM